MRKYTPINYYKLSSRGKEIFNQCKDVLKCNVPHVHVFPSDFIELLDGISPSTRQFYIDGIPLDGKMVVKKTNELILK